MRVDPSGNVGIGTATPGASLEVAGTGAKFSGTIATETHTDANLYAGVLDSSPRIIFGGSTTTHEIDNDGSRLRFFRPGVVDMVIDSSGNVGIGSGLTASTVTAGIINANGEVLVNNAPGTATIVLDGNGAMIDVGAPGADGGITVYDKTHSATCVINGSNGKIVTEALLVTKGAIFGGDVIIEGRLQVNGPIDKRGGGFKIDHPLDPANKYLAHSFVESPDMKNIYDGVAVLDANGEAIVELPEWFAALNRDLRYQLTCIGDYAPIYIARKMQGTSFKIAGGKPEMEISWQVTGIRQDAWACTHRICAEEEKPPAEQGYYLHSEENGADAAMSIQQIRRSQSV